ncbi:SRPBCC domain-containing protein [Sphingomonas oleivorans]|uniref:SRPBCC domain-containing protein n=1 Tax=Sphingomonas oleivorans TaxID=1735121 RepID=UPI003C6EF63F
MFAGMAPALEKPLAIAMAMRSGQALDDARRQRKQGHEAFGKRAAAFDRQGDCRCAPGEDQIRLIERIARHRDPSIREAAGNVTKMSNEGVFLEIVPNEKIVFTNAFSAGWISQDPFMVAIVTFEPEGAGTRYTASATGTRRR